MQAPAYFSKTELRTTTREVLPPEQPKADAYLSGNNFSDASEFEHDEAFTAGPHLRVTRAQLSKGTISTLFATLHVFIG